MRIAFLQRHGITYLEIADGQMVGLSRTRPGDKFNPALGVAVALLKAEDGPLPSDDYRIYKAKMEKLVNENSPKKLDLNNITVLRWHILWHEYRLALRAVAAKRAEYEQAKFPLNLSMGTPGIMRKFEGMDAYMRPWMEKKKPHFPSDGELAERFGLRLLDGSSLRLALKTETFE